MAHISPVQTTINIIGVVVVIVVGVCTRKYTTRTCTTGTIELWNEPGPLRDPVLVGNENRVLVC